jgi:transcription antitermination factor NusG
MHGQPWRGIDLPESEIDAAHHSWFVVRTQPCRERWAAENCHRQGAETYLPQIEESTRVVTAGRMLTTLRPKPLFPGYLFVRTLGYQWRFLLGTFGVIDLIANANGPSRLRHSVIEDLRQRERGGFVQLPKVVTRFSPTDKVRPNEGAFEGITGLVEGYVSAKRVQVLLDFLGRKVPVLFAEEQLDAA